MSAVPISPGLARNAVELQIIFILHFGVARRCLINFMRTIVIAVEVPGRILRIRLQLAVAAQLDLEL